MQKTNHVDALACGVSDKLRSVARPYAFCDLLYLTFCLSGFLSLQWNRVTEMSGGKRKALILDTFESRMLVFVA